MAVILSEEVTSETLVETLVAQAKGRSAKPKKVEEDDFEEEDEAPKKSAKKAKADDDDDDDDDIEGDDEEVDDEWDPDFENLICLNPRREKAAKEKKRKNLKLRKKETLKTWIFSMTVASMTTKKIFNSSQ